MRKSCAVCGEPFEAKRAAAKYCGDRCRQRAHRSPEAASESKVLEPAGEPTSEPPPALLAGPVTLATMVELEDAGRLETALGQAALALARRIDFPATDTGSALASLAREHRATLAEAVRDAKTAMDPLDELRLRRERKLAGG